MKYVTMIDTVGGKRILDCRYVRVDYCMCKRYVTENVPCHDHVL